MADKNTIEELIQGARAAPNVTLDDFLWFAKKDADEQERVFKTADMIHFLILGKTDAGKLTLGNGLKVTEGQFGLMTTSPGATSKVEPYDRKIDDLDTIVRDITCADLVENIHIKSKPPVDKWAFVDKLTADDRRAVCSTLEMEAIVLAEKVKSIKTVPTSHESQSELLDGTLSGDLRALCSTLETKGRVPAEREKSIKMLLTGCESQSELLDGTLSVDLRAICCTLKMEARVPAEREKSIKIIPTSRESQSELLDNTLWFLEFWLEYVATLEAHAYMIKANTSQLKTQKEVTGADFDTSLPHQPIRTLLNQSYITALSVPAVIGGLIGCLGFIGGPVGVLTVPLGYAVGMAVGIFVAVEMTLSS